MWPDDETPEPAAWINFNAATGGRNVSFVCESDLASIPLWPEPPRHQRKPMTEEEIAALFPAHLSGDYKDIIPYSFARAIERAHGIE